MILNNSIDGEIADKDIWIETVFSVIKILASNAPGLGFLATQKITAKQELQKSNDKEAISNKIGANLAYYITHGIKCSYFMTGLQKIKKSLP